MTRCRLAATLVLVALAAGASATQASAATRWLSLRTPHTLRARPAASARIVARVREHNMLGARRIVEVVAERRSGMHVWLLIAVGRTRGWTVDEGFYRARRPLVLPARMVRSLAGLMAQAGDSDGLVVADADDGQMLYYLRPDAPRTLASNTKLFVTGAALGAYGPSIGGLLQNILLPSNNELAQDLYDRLGGSGPVESFASKHGASISIGDGSGLDPDNVASPLSVVRFLLDMRHVYGFPVWQGALPVAGESGTLADRMQGSSAAGRCHAKTGTLYLGVPASALSGYCATRHGHHVVFSILMNWDSNTDAAESLQDQIVELLTSRL